MGRGDPGAVRLEPGLVRRRVLRGAPLGRWSPSSPVGQLVAVPVEEDREPVDHHDLERAGMDQAMVVTTQQRLSHEPGAWFWTRGCCGSWGAAVAALADRCLSQLEEVVAGAD